MSTSLKSLVGPNFALPDTFAAMFNHGWMSYDGSDRDSFGTYVWLYDMEWELGRTEQYLATCTGRECDVIPFAVTGGGDIWGYYVSPDTIQTAPVVLCERAETTCKYYASTIEGAIFRQILAFCSEPNFVRGDENTEMDMCLRMAKKHLTRWKTTFGLSFPKTWKDVCDDLLSRELTEHIEGHVSYPVLISPSEAKEFERCIEIKCVFDGPLELDPTKLDSLI
jgi:hypothetical protein